MSFIPSRIPGSLLVVFFCFVASHTLYAVDAQAAPSQPVQMLQEAAPKPAVPVLALQGIIVSWFFIFGACFGSFLNVVIYRLPAGMSLGKPKSRCPRCETQLAARDNIPVLGWLLLRGRCRYCALPISARYPFIEAVCGGVFVLLLYGELLTGAANLPLRTPDHFHVHPGYWLVWFTRWNLLGLYLFHCGLLVIVLAITMIGYDGHRPVQRLTRFGVLWALILGTIWSQLRPVPAWPYSMPIRQLEWGFVWVDRIVNPGTPYWTGVTLTGFLDGIAGMVAGAAAGWLVRWQMIHSRSSEAIVSWVSAISSALLVIGVFVGWQAVGMLLIILLPVLALVKWGLRYAVVRQRQAALAPLFFVCLTAFMLSWRYLNDSPWVPGHNGWSQVSLIWWQEWLATLVIVAVFATVVRLGVPSAQGAPGDAELTAQGDDSVASEGLSE